MEYTKHVLGGSDYIIVNALSTVLFGLVLFGIHVANECGYFSKIIFPRSVGLLRCASIRHSVDVNLLWHHFYRLEN